jgi:hypothetical protein
MVGSFDLDLLFFLNLFRWATRPVWKYWPFLDVV